MSKERAKGTWFESLVLPLFEFFYPHATRAPLHGAKDKGDLLGMPYVVQCKNDKSFKFSQWVDDAAEQAANAKKPYGIVVVKRPRRGQPAEQYVVMTLDTWLKVAPR